MKRRLLDVLACPNCLGPLRLESRVEAGEVIETGVLHCDACPRAYPIVNGIPRFVPTTSYADSFGLQWNEFVWEQIDKDNRTGDSLRRLRAEAPFNPAPGEWILDAGCGAGRFLDVAAGWPGEVVGLDISNAVEAAAKVTRGRPNVHVVQASMYAPPFKPGTFQFAYCIGVIQHTPDPLACIKALAGPLRTGGQLAVTVYERRRFTRLNAKYLVRPVTRRLPPRVLLGLVKAVMPVAWPATEVLYRIPGFGRAFRFLIPVANYVENHKLSWRQRYRWAVLDTFDMLAPAYDQPQTEANLRQSLAANGFASIHRLPNPGVNLVAVRSGGRPSASER